MILCIFVQLVYNPLLGIRIIMKYHTITGIAVATAVATALIVAQYASATVSGPTWAQVTSFQCRFEE